MDGYESTYLLVYISVSILHYLEESLYENSRNRFWGILTHEDASKSREGMTAIYLLKRIYIRVTTLLLCCFNFPSTTRQAGKRLICDSVIERQWSI